jgi:uncharacterized protein (DUF2267 family)
MRHPEFIERVMANVDFESRDQAELVIKESLAALGERSYRTEQDKLAAQLPKDLREYLSSRAEAETMRGDTDRYSLEAFYNRVSARTDVGFPEVIERSSYLTIFTASGSLVGSLRSLQRMLRQGFDRLNQHSVRRRNQEPPPKRGFDMLLRRYTSINSVRRSTSVLAVIPKV